MQLKMYSIRDQKSEIFNIPFYKLTDGEAQRDFGRLANDPQSMISLYPQDFDLYYLGIYDDNNGKFDLVDTPLHVIKAVQLKQTGQTEPTLPPTLQLAPEALIQRQNRKERRSKKKSKH